VREVEFPQNMDSRDRASSHGPRDTSGVFDGHWRAKALCAGTWLLEGEGCTSYLVVGDERGVVIDTGYATENIQAYAQTLTDKPLTWAANTHGHFDHTGGNGWFELAYMSARAAEIAKIPYPSKAELTYPRDYQIKIVGDGDTIDLGGRVLEVIEIPAHAPSSVAFLDRKQRLLFTGDEVADFVMLYWQQDCPQPTVQQHARNLEKLLSHRAEFDHILCGHGQGLQDASLVEDCLENARRILSGMQGEPMAPRGDSAGEGPDPRDFVMYRPEFKRVSTYKDTNIGYDVRYVFDRQPDSRAQGGESLD
jgi:glyoxylase-like metal-dependent hydrolase (beta-lactamase superfamily II)